MRYPLVATDMDGTLLSSSLNISAYTKSVIGRYRKKGGTFIVSTGRMYASFYNTAVRLGIADGLVIAFQGAYIKDMRDDSLLYHKTLPNETALKVLRALEKENVALQIYFDDKLFVKERTKETEMYEKACEIKAYELKQTLSDYVGNNNIAPTKILAFSEEQKVKHLNQKYPPLYGGEAEFHISRPYFFEVVAKGSDKGSAVDYLCRKMGLTADDVITFGDNYNDVSMLKYANLSFAVENANDAAKAAAKHICPSNDEDGVAKMIEKYCL
ncbi:MAG: Cof-type HAD-IIB family hydrolase [Clostridia bacterium]|nr:Cof-type HAD-IIB family hydrolase [Clostridia bacterium]